MRRESTTSESAYEETTALVQELDALKQHGSNLLIVGSRMPAAHNKACQQFLGEPAAQARRRLFVLADPCTPTFDRFSSEASIPAGHHSLIHYSATNRSAAVATSLQSAHVPTRQVDGDLGSLGLAISETIAEFEIHGGGLSPAELRLCFDSLTPLVSEYEPESVFRFLHLLTHRIRSVDGMGHYHLTAERSNRTVALLEPLFDAVIELCLRGGVLHQRWYLRDSGLTTGWLQL